MLNQASALESVTYINGTFATHEEILDYAKKRGFITEDGNTYYYKGIKINDLNPLNVLKTPNEGYAVIDAELRFTGIMQEDSIGNSVETPSPHDSKRLY